MQDCTGNLPPLPAGHAHGARLCVARHGTPESLTDASNFVRTIAHRQGTQICCPEEIAFEKGFIDAFQLGKLARELGKSSYGRYLDQVLRDHLKDGCEVARAGAVIALAQWAHT